MVIQISKQLLCLETQKNLLFILKFWIKIKFIMCAYRFGTIYWLEDISMSKYILNVVQSNWDRVKTRGKEWNKGSIVSRRRVGERDKEPPIYWRFRHDAKVTVTVRFRFNLYADCSQLPFNTFCFTPILFSAFLRCGSRVAECAVVRGAIKTSVADGK